MVHMLNRLKVIRTKTASTVAGASCTIDITPQQAETKGMAWIIGAFLVCPCHLPITLGVLTTLLAGTAVGGWCVSIRWWQVRSSPLYG